MKRKKYLALLMTVSMIAAETPHVVLATVNDTENSKTSSSEKVSKKAAKTESSTSEKEDTKEKNEDTETNTEENTKDTEKIPEVTETADETELTTNVVEVKTLDEFAEALAGLNDDQVWTFAKENTEETMIGVQSYEGDTCMADGEQFGLDGTVDVTEELAEKKGFDVQTEADGTVTVTGAISSI